MGLMGQLPTVGQQHWEEGQATQHTNGIGKHRPGEDVTAEAGQGADAAVEQGSGSSAQGEDQSVPVYVMLPLDTVNAEGIFRYANSTWFNSALQALAGTGIRGVAVDVWWGAVERRPRQYSWGGYRQLFDLVREMGLKLQVVMSFHACGGNVGDNAQIPLPPWVLQVGEADPDIFFTDRPRRTPGQRNRECLTLFADEEPGLLKGRSPLQCYTDFMRAFRDEFMGELGSLIEEVVVGSGPCGELRYPSYPEANGWRFPGVGEFQCYDRRALASLAAAAREAGHPEWGHSGPQDTGQYNSTPEETGFFSSWGGVWDSPYGRFFLEWYSNALLEHGERMLAAACMVFNVHREGTGPRLVLQQPRQGGTGTSGGRSFSLPNLSTVVAPSPRLDPGGPLGIGGLGPVDWQQQQQQGAQQQGQQQQAPPPQQQQGAQPQQGQGQHPPHLAARHSATSGNGAQPSPSVDMLDASSSGGSDSNSSPPDTPSSNQAAAASALSPGGGRPPPAPAASPLSARGLQRSLPSWGCIRSSKSDGSEEAWPASVSGLAPAGPPVELSLKVAGVHWWYRTRSHAGELTAGYYNCEGRDGYAGVLDLCRRYGTSLTLTCVEMCDSQHPPEALCGPEGLLRQVRESAAKYDVPVAGENALPCFMPAAIDEIALQRIVYNTQPWGTPLQQGSAGDDASSFGGPATPSELISIAQAAVPAPASSGMATSGSSEAGQQHQQVAGSPGSSESGGSGSGGDARSAELPPLRAFTFLRLSNEMMTEEYQDSWRAFMQAMQRNAQQFKSSRTWRRTLGLEGW